MKSNIKTVIYFLLILNLLFFTACNKDDIDTIDKTAGINTGTEANNEETSRLDKIISSETISTNLNIVVIDKNNNTISNASIKVGGKTATTNETGAVLIENIDINKEFQVITTQSTGYTTSLKTITPSSNGVTNVSITLLQPTFSKTFTATEGGTIANDKIAIEFPSNAIADQNGNLYEGEVITTVTYYDPNADSFSATAPGLLVGLDENDAMQALISKGMIKVDLTDTSGEELELFEGKEATITLPANENDPESIDFWHLNEEKGIWVQTGTATKVGNEYVAIVTHFSTYNLDVKVPAISINFIIKDTKGNLIANQKLTLKITHESGTYSKVVTTDNMGEFTILHAPKGGEFDVYLSACEEIITSAGVINETTTKELTIEPLNSIAITLEGVLYTCDNTVFANKAFGIKLKNGSETDRIIVYTNSHGEYNITTFLCNYDTTTTYNAEIRVYNAKEDIVTETEFIFNTDNLLKSINVCNGSIEVAEERIFNGDYEIQSDEEFEKFIAVHYTKINGNLNIHNLTATSLTGLESLSIVEGSFKLENNYFLTSLKGLENLIGAENIQLTANVSLKNLENLNSLTNTSLSLTKNHSLTSLKGIENNIVSNYPDFTLVLNDNLNLTDITALSSITQFATLLIIDNSNLNNLAGLESVTSINTLAILGNPMLTDYCSLNKVMINNLEENNSETFYFSISENAYNPTKQDLLDGSCSE